ncbi:MAG: Hsp20/alpha crystallin family protein [Microthrixaceae bacterium]|nr:Hsp20/alpha crystallin family protein [Microthrixaceae bacterium]
MLVTNRDPFRQLDRQLSWFGPFSSQLPVDVIRREGELELRVDVPGVSADQLDVTVEQRVLTISVERHTSVAEGDTFVARERRHGKAGRAFTLSAGLDPSALEASLDTGVLTIRIPVAEAAKPQKVHVEINSPAPAIEAAAN